MTANLTGLYNNNNSDIAAANGNICHTLTTIRPSDIWIGDLLFLRQNRSLKYTKDGFPLILEAVQWEELWPRLLRSIGWICVHCDAILLNFLVLLLSFRKTKQQAYHKKVQFLLGNLAICNIVLALGLLAYTFLVDVWYDVDSFDTLLALNGPPHLGGNLWRFSKFLIHSELVENFFIVQQLVLLLASIDRYAALFHRHYSPDGRHKLLLATISSVPYLLALLPLDRHLMRMWMDANGANIVRLLALLCPLLFSLVFSGCALLGLLQQRRTIQRIFGRAHFRDECSFSAALFALISMDSVAKLAIFLELLGANFAIRITAGDAELGTFLDTYYSLAHFLLLLSPLLHAILSLLGVTFYRRRLLAILRHLLRCHRRPPLDYSCETMRSIIAEQTVRAARQQRQRAANWGPGSGWGTAAGNRKVGIGGTTSGNGTAGQQMAAPRRK